MASRRQVREAVIQFLYCADLEGGANPAELREPFWEFVTESDRRSLLVATFRTIHHLSHGRKSRLEEFYKREESAQITLAAWPEAESLKTSLGRIAKLENRWSEALSSLEKTPKDGDDSSTVTNFGSGLATLFAIDHDLENARHAFLNDLDAHPNLRGRLESVAATIRRLQRISDRLRMVEEPEKFPEQADLSKIRESRERLTELRKDADALADQVIQRKDSIDEELGQIVENFAPERIDPVDRAILRLAAYEIKFAEIPAKVAINEAIELAKRFGTSDSQRFVNGILDKLAKLNSASSESS